MAGAGAGCPWWCRWPPPRGPITAVSSESIDMPAAALPVLQTLPPDGAGKGAGACAGRMGG